MRTGTWKLLFLCCFCTFSQAHWYWDGSAWLICQCSGRSSLCVYDQQLFEQTGYGGRCLNCTGNTTGHNCELCQDGFYRPSMSTECVPCSCHPHGVSNPRKSLCDSEGRCKCKVSVTGDKCDRCQPGYFDLGPEGCKKCPCWEAGTVPGEKNECGEKNGSCVCKQNVEGEKCDICKRGFFGLRKELKKGCKKCFCNRHSYDCTQASGYSIKSIESNFNFGLNGWKIESRNGVFANSKVNPKEKSISVLNTNVTDAVYFIAPPPFLRNKLLSYGLKLSFRLKLMSIKSNDAMSADDLILKGNGYQVMTSIASQGNPTPNGIYQNYSFRLDESTPWQPQLSVDAFYIMMANITSIKIRGVYGTGRYAALQAVSMEIATVAEGGGRATDVEQCSCPEGYTGRACESCAVGYQRHPLGGDSFARCVPCDCNGHAVTCDPDTGRCACQHHTTGAHCQRCQAGYYGYAMAGTADDCKKCICPFNGACTVLMSGEVSCIDCREGYTGRQCTECADGFYGDPQAEVYIIARPCRKCDCSGNVDPNAVGNCDRLLGTCRKCVYNTQGDHCENCLPGYYGNATGPIKGDCKLCDCDHRGTTLNTEAGQSCDAVSGQCVCKRHVTGRGCDACAPGHWNIDGVNGCEPCICDMFGTVHEPSSCDMDTGRCICKPGVVGMRCDRCDRNWYGFSPAGCLSCDCHPSGAAELHCHQVTGRCRCKAGVLGTKCDTCPENFHDILAGCRPCPDCYRQVKKGVGHLTRDIATLTTITEDITTGLSGPDREILQIRLANLGDDLQDLYKATLSKFPGTPISLQLQAIEQGLSQVTTQHRELVSSITMATAALETAANDTKDMDGVLQQGDKQVESQKLTLVQASLDLERSAKKIKDHGPVSKRLAAIAKEARGFSQLTLSVADTIFTKAKNGLLANKETHFLLVSMDASLADVATKAENTRKMLEGKSTYLDKVARVAASAKLSAGQLYSKSLTLYSRASGLRLPKKNNIYETINHIRKLLHTTKKHSESFTAYAEETVLQTKSSFVLANELLGNASAEQHILNTTRREMFKADSVAQLAVNATQAIVARGREINETLSSFESEVQVSEAQARQAFLSMPVVEGRVEAAGRGTGLAEGAVGQSTGPAGAALAESHSARDSASQTALEGAAALRRVRQTRARAAKGGNRLRGFTSQLRSLRFQWADRERQGNMDRLLSAAAVEYTDDTRDISRQTKQSTDSALERISELLSEVETSKTIRLDGSKLDRLERELLLAEKAWEPDNIHSKYTDIEQSVKKQSTMIESFTREKLSLEDDVRTLNLIKNSIPKQCWSSINLEPLDQRGKR